jgi:hypothetical protein
MLAIMPFLNQNNSFSNVMAQEYDKYGDSSYSQYPTDDKKYECQTGPFEGFFVSSVEFCKHVKFDDNRKDVRDNRTGTQGPAGPQGPPGINGTNGINGVNGINGISGSNGAQGPQGIQGIQGPIGPNGTQGDIGPAGLSVINDTNIYRNVSSVDFVAGNSNSTTATCDPGDTPLSGGHEVGDISEATHNFDLIKSGLSFDGEGWTVDAEYSGPPGDFIVLSAEVNCFDNPPAHIP